MSLKNVQNGKEFSREMSESLSGFQQLANRRLPEKVEVELEKIVMDSFQDQQFKDKSTSKWQGRKKVDDGRALMVKTGKLKRSFETNINGKEISIGSDEVYAQIHNEGLQGRAYGKYVFRMPQRQMMPIPGESNAHLDEVIEKFIDAEMDKLFL